MSEENKAPKVGRPTAYEDRFVEAMEKYFDVIPYEEKDIKVVTKSGDVVETSEDVANDFPTLAGFAVSIGVHRDTLHEWANAKHEDGSLKHPDFSDIYKKAKDYQERYLSVNGPKGLINAPFSIFLAKNILKWRDKQPDEIDTQINNTNNNLNLPKSDDDLDKRIKELEEKLKGKE